jgi:hypothetical protein
MGTPSRALPVLFIAVCLMALWHYPQQKSLGHVTVLQTQNFLLYELAVSRIRDLKHNTIIVQKLAPVSTGRQRAPQQENN